MNDDIISIEQKKNALRDIINNLRKEHNEACLFIIFSQKWPDMTEKYCTCGVYKNNQKIDEILEIINEF